MGKLFGTDGVRGVVNTELTCELAFKLGRAGAYILARRYDCEQPRILIGKDTRASGDMLEAALAAGICSVGAQVISVGTIPTPAIAYLSRYYQTQAGVVISASHNPFEYNGIKFFNADGYKLPDEVEDEIEELILNDKLDNISCTKTAEVGVIQVIDNAALKYIDFLKSTVNISLEGMKIAVDCANGASYKVAPTVLEQLGADVVIIGGCPNGKNINYNCGSTHPEALQQFVLESKADAGLAFDGDADRLIAVDDKGELVDGDKILAICGIYLKEKGMLSKNTVVATIMSNLGLDITLKKAGCNVVRTAVGDRYVLEKMVEDDYVLGGEQSGHIIFRNHSTTGDGLVTALQLLTVMVDKGQRLSDLSGIMKPLPQVLVNARVKNNKKYDYINDEVIAKEIEEIQQRFKDQGRVVIRPSGTEPLIRVMLEGTDKDYMEHHAQKLVRLIEERLA
ncbi:MAG TPA: phosphoglucosamine mutase [Clostridiales bacterium]|nr:phosphoglucosamine mutase [Clostridiales bacterium]